MLLDKQTIFTYLAKNNDYETPDTSLSQLYSNIGLAIAPGEAAVGAFWLHYNRFSRVFWHKTALLPAAISKEKSAPWRVVFGEEQAELGYFAPDSFLLSVRGEEKIKLLREPDDMLGETWYLKKTPSVVLLRGFTKNGDARDPDEFSPFLLGVRAMKGRLTVRKDGLAAIPQEGETLLAFSFEVLETDEKRILKKLRSAPDSVQSAAEITKKEIGRLASSLHLELEEEAVPIAARAVGGLISNLTKAPGRLRGHLAAYPSRGYSSHFLWDTCFQNLAYEEMNVDVARECLLTNVLSQRADGKYEQFLCSTWGRPHYTQPPLIGWAALRVYHKAPDKAFAAMMYTSLKANNDWWLQNRITPIGLISCPHGLETGQDDSPRFDDGATVACDMNAFMLSQLEAEAFFAAKCGKKRAAAEAKKRAAAFEKKMVDYLYDAEDNLFYDRRVKDGSFVKLVSPVSFLPLWAGVKLPEEKAREMIEKYLLSPEYLFGEIPFPSVAYHEPTYRSDGWWRGPTWMPEAWLMLETLEKCGYVKERDEALARLYRMLVRDGKCHELFDSSTGKGLGESEQGWTCAIFLKLASMQKKKG